MEDSCGLKSQFDQWLRCYYLSFYLVLIPVVDLYCVNLENLALCFLEFPSLHSSGLTLATRDILHEIWQAEMKQQQLFFNFLIFFFHALKVDVDHEALLISDMLSLTY